MRVLAPLPLIARVGLEWTIHAKPHHEFTREPPDVLHAGDGAVLSHELPPRFIPLSSLGFATMQPLVEAPRQPDGEGVDIDIPAAKPFSQFLLLREDVVLL